METRFPKQTGPQSASNSAASAATPADDPHPKSGASAPPKNLRKMKRTLTPDNLFRTVANFVTSLPVLVRALRSPKTSAALREKVVLGVTSINDCRYCQWGHTHWAMANGVPLEEVNQILGLQIESLEAKNPAEAAAILFAQHYAEQLDQFDPESIENLRKYYSDAQVTEILAYVRAITLANLTRQHRGRVSRPLPQRWPHQQRWAHQHLFRWCGGRGSRPGAACAGPVGKVRPKGGHGQCAVTLAPTSPGCPADPGL